MAGNAGFSVNQTIQKLKQSANNYDLEGGLDKALAGKSENQLIQMQKDKINEQD
jgi:hypothetical protein